MFPYQIDIEKVYERYVLHFQGIRSILSSSNGGGLVIREACCAGEPNIMHAIIFSSQLDIEKVYER